MRHLKTLLLGIFLLATALITKANAGKPICIQVQGYVTDAVTKKPVSGVVVSATAAGINGTTEAKTDADGYFSFGQLPALQVTLQFGKKGYQNYKKTNISVNEKAPVKLIVEFVPETKDEDADETEYPILRILHFS